MTKGGKGKKNTIQQKKKEIKKQENSLKKNNKNNKNDVNVKNTKKKSKFVVENSEEENSDNYSSDNNIDIDNFISEQTINNEEGNKKNEVKDNENKEENDNNQKPEIIIEKENEENEEEEEEERELPAINDTAALNKRYNDIRLDIPGVKIPWIELQTITYNKDLGIDDKTVHDDLKRELAFYEQGLAAALEGRKKYKALNKPFSRPNDYFAEMVKTDEQMSKIRQNMIEEQPCHCRGRGSNPRHGTK
ncbi:eukaryotic rRNA processing protein EBP2-domain-containing protein [Neocallimastix sp. 'constans']